MTILDAMGLCRLEFAFLLSRTLQLRENVMFLGGLLMGVLSRSTQQNNETELGFKMVQIFSNRARYLIDPRRIMSFKSS